jgi:adenylate kinase family enzyme
MAGRQDHLSESAAVLRQARRINVVGTSGSGKTTFSRQLAEVLGLPLHEMDRLFWLPGWRQRPEEDFMAQVGEAVSGAAWILDGNYDRSRAVKWATVECVVWIDYSLGRTMYQAVRRALVRSIGRKEIWPGTGNRESLRKSFFSRESILLWTLTTFRSNRARYREMIADEARAFAFVRIGSRKEAARLLEMLGEGSEGRVAH